MKRLFKLLLLLSLSISSFVFAATSGKIAGQVKDAESGEPLPGVNVIVENTNLGGATNLNGEFFIINIPPGTYTVKANYMGYSSKSVTNVQVNIDRTTLLNYDLTQSILQGEEIVVVGGREKIHQDVSYSQRSISESEIISVPTGVDIRETIAMGVGIERNLYGHISIRGGEVDEVGFFVDGFTQNDKRSGLPNMQVPKASIQEVQVLTGGFNAEYGEARSGMINIVTKEGGLNYHGSVDYRMSPAALKHFGPNIFSPDNYWQVGRFLTLEPSPDRDGDGNPDFEGWNSFYERNAPATMGESPEELLEIWKWRHRPLEYGNEPDHYFEGTFGGPVPFTNGKLSFFANGYYDRTLYAFRFSRPYYSDKTGNLKLRYDISEDMTLRLKGNYGETNSCTYDGYAFNDQSLKFVNVHSFDNMAESYSMSQLYNSDSRMPLTSIWKGVGGADFTHILNVNSFYEVKFQYDRTRYRVHPSKMRNTSVVKKVGNVGLDETPVGFSADKWKDQLNLHRLSEDYGYRDYSWYETYSLRGDYTNQITTIHQLKMGVGGSISKMHLAYGRDLWASWPKYRFDWWTSKSIQFMEGYVYAQDKIEFEGMIMNLGIRADVFDPHEPIFADTWSKYYTKINYDSLYFAPQSDSKAKVMLSPRLGISHPINANSKLFFNYGYFFQRADIGQLYQDIQRPTTILRQMSNPDLEPRKTISYELGVEQNVGDMFSYTLTGYYKDVTGEIDQVLYAGIKDISFLRYMNSRYKDIRGFELQVDIPRISYFSGWLNYNYMLTSSGWYGWSTIYQDPLVKNVLRSPNQNKPKARPWFRANLMFSTPQFNEAQWYKKVVSDFRVSAYVQWRSGEWLTYHSENYPGVEENNVHWKAWKNVDLNITKGISMFGIRTYAYCEIHNLFNTKSLASESSRYDPVEVNAYLDIVKQEGIEPGEFDNPKVEQLLDKAKYWALYGAPRDVWFGLRFEF